MASPLPEYTLHRSPRSRRLRLTIDSSRGLVVTVPPVTRRGWAHPEPTIERFLVEVEAWIRRLLERHARERAELLARVGLRDGATIRYRGELHRLRIVDVPAARRSTVARVGAEAGDEIVVRISSRDRRAVAHVLDGWFRERARAAIDAAIARHAAALAVQPDRVSVRDQRSRWGSASRQKRLSFSWRLVLAPPEALDTVVVHELAHLRVFGHGPRFWALVASRRPDHVRWRRWLREHAYELHAALDDAPPTDELATA
jgi:hypothetical protein